MPSSLRWIINLTVLFFVILLLAYVGLLVASVYDQNPDHQKFFVLGLAQLPSISLTAWSFIRPFLQLILVLVIIDWLLGKWGISFKTKVAGLEWNVQTVIALIVVGAFSIAALGGITGADVLKDLALVVVGFYFGTQRQTMQVQSGSSTVTTIEEHDNPIVEHNEVGADAKDKDKEPPPLEPTR